MREFRAGQFGCVVSGPYPCWLVVEDEQGREFRFGHGEVSDLIYVLERAKNEARRLLGEDAGEVD